MKIYQGNKCWQCIFAPRNKSIELNQESCGDCSIFQELVEIEEDRLLEKEYVKIEGHCEYQMSDYCSVLKDDCNMWQCPEIERSWD